MTKKRFLANTLHHLTHTLETVAGIEEAEAFLSTVGAELGQDLYDEHFAQPGAEPLHPDTLPEMLVDVETGIGADFAIVERSKNRILLENRTCPFGPEINGTPSICMVTANLLGHLASKSAGYAKVHLEQTIARGHPMCRVNVSLDDNDTPGLEYFADD
ncbi:methanogen output domain 1-containing protein [Thalassovita aquimarina]|uniref:Transcriptional regulator n=1 Tax=Thalassovita aquimarina TaxID=2785917 RepID=A0ABS5HKY7_9RHOB|nr:methanogen output domain 1-containing protein [Thalassovita aquimarina]MBR9649644.1 transcriptional regulator [Thalassovita aquimarina]